MGDHLLEVGILISMAPRLDEILGIRYPIIMAPMFLISNVRMSLAAIESGIAPCIPALNFKSLSELEEALQILQKSGACYGINLVVNKSNYKLSGQLKLCLKYKVPFIITSLGNPSNIVRACSTAGIRVFCDVSTMTYAVKAAACKPDGLIAITNKAGGHLGEWAPEILIPQLIEAFPEMPIIAAGGVGDYQSYKALMDMGVSGVSVGTVFIASEEAPVQDAYKNACVHYDEKDIVTTTKLSGIPCTVINTAYVQKTGTKQNKLQFVLNRFRPLKKLIKLITYERGMHILKKAAFDLNYRNVWVAGTSIKFVNRIKPIREIVQQIVSKQPDKEPV